MNARLVILVGLLAATTIARAAEPPSLAHNPFSRPPSERTVPDTRSPRSEDDGPVGLVLTATMVAGNDRLANIDGRVMRPGDEIEGYELLQVFEDRAVFDKNGRQLTVYVKPELVDDPVDNDE